MSYNPASELMMREALACDNMTTTSKHAPRWQRKAASAASPATRKTPTKRSAKTPGSPVVRFALACWLSSNGSFLWRAQ